MKKTYLILILITVIAVFISAFSNYDKAENENLLGPCFQKICVIDTGTTYLSGVLIEIDSVGNFITSCVTDTKKVCC